MKFYCSKKVFYLLTVIVLLFWIVFLFAPTKSCVDTYPLKGLGFHWTICSDMSFSVNLLFVAMLFLLILLSGYLIAVGTMFYNFEK